MLKIKELCTPDKRNEFFGITIDVLKTELIKVSISDRVPGKIKAMLDFAKKICLYAYFEYDFYTLTLIYGSLLVETAIKERFLQELPDMCQLKKKKEQKEIKKSYQGIYMHLLKNWRIVGYEEVAKSLGSILRWLRKYQIVPKRMDEKMVESLIELRNMSAHLDAHNINLPTMVIPIIWRMFDFVNCLYDPSVHNKEPKVISQQLDFYRQIFEEFEKLNRGIRRKQ